MPLMGCSRLAIGAVDAHGFDAALAFFEWPRADVALPRATMRR